MWFIVPIFIALIHLCFQNQFCDARGSDIHIAAFIVPCDASISAATYSLNVSFFIDLPAIMYIAYVISKGFHVIFSIFVGS